ncbi:MAG: oligosaccharide flippase family protein [Hyphomicrobiaceae bacterium]
MATGYVVEAALPVLRTIALARLLPQDQFGIAITGLATITMAEMCCDVGLGTSALRGSTSVPYRPFVGTLHSLAIVRSIVMIAVAFVLLTIQHATIDSKFGPDLFMLAFALLALRAFENMTLKQYARQYDFRFDTILMSGAQIVWTIVAVIAALITHSYAAMFWGQVASALWIAAYSNWVAPDKWRLDWQPQAAKEAISFGAPLMPNGLVSAVSSSDRFLVGSFLGTRAVAVYGVSMSLATLPRSIMYRVTTSMLVSHFTNLVSEPDRLRSFYHRWIAFIAFVALTYGVALIVLGPFLIGLAFGAAYRPTTELAGLIAINVFIKFMMLVPVPACYAKGETSLVLLGSTISGVSALPAALMLYFGMRSLENFVLALNIFEGGGLIIYFWLMARRHGLRARFSLLAVIVPLALLCGLTLSSR